MRDTNSGIYIFTERERWATGSQRWPRWPSTWPSPSPASMFITRWGRIKDDFFINNRRHLQQKQGRIEGDLSINKTAGLKTTFAKQKLSRIVDVFFCNKTTQPDGRQLLQKQKQSRIEDDLWREKENRTGWKTTFATTAITKVLSVRRRFQMFPCLNI